jgi:L-histidine N-alpha-methyltransferase
VAAGAALAAEYPQIGVHAVVGDFGHHLLLLAGGGRRLVAFLSGTTGNLSPAQRAAFLTTLAGTLGPPDALLLVTDRVNDEDRLVRTYDDAGGSRRLWNPSAGRSSRERRSRAVAAS